MKKLGFLKRRYLLNRKEMEIRFIRIAAVFLITAVSSAQQLGSGFADNVPDLTQPIKSGIYELNTTNYVNGDGSASWYHLFVMRHSNQSNNHQLQLSSSYAENDRLFFRKIANTQGAVWNELATRGTNNFIGNQSVSGNVGIGTLNPVTKLSVVGGISKLTETGVDGAFDNLIKYGHKSDLESATSYANRWHGIDATITAGTAEQNKLKFRLYSGGTGNLIPVDVMTLVGNGNVGIGTSTPSNVQGWGRVFDVAGVDNSKILATSRNGLSRVGIFSHNDWYGGGGFVGTESNHPLHLITNYNVKMSILTNGNVGVGTVNPDSKLTVAGNIHAQEVKVTARAGEVPDYVFANDYKLKSLEEVERYIKQNSHLPEIPSAKEIEKNGLMLGEMNMNLLKKMEEMTLYMIEQNKRIKDLEKQIEEIKRK